ncbi:hypothetical protein AB9K34_17675 [Sedimentitalea sp. XS_ASV28]|uniref:hypothetical protein n=1 Tax=Sedimentitalea sp. XS_ASV28 TaxID=3241296 RepID=UPI0035159343
MRSFVLFLKIAALLAFSAFPANAQGLIDRFPALWSEFFRACGGVIEAPEQMEENLPTLSDLPRKSFAKSTDGGSLVLNQSSTDYRSFTYVHLLSLTNGYWIECEISTLSEDDLDQSSVASTLTGMLSASGEMTVSGGQMRDLPTSNTSMEQFGDGPWNLIVVEGVFPGRSIPVMIDIESGSVTIRVAGLI